MIRYRLLVSGRVQRVGFRFFSQYIATNLNITGFAKNLSNGIVELEIQGEEEKLDEMVLLLKRGNGIIRVDNIDIKTISVIDGEIKFQILSESNFDFF